ncbi:hypothetical protein [Micromonospora rosaria]|uniref:hypothetical protein n=1 Tax=Micromonospora rosaria TaxID=47874 RepID=UPI0009FBEED6|nr:hypothetical protein [Micromonospora rosaria]
MTVRDVPERRRDRVLHVVGATRGDRCVARPGPINPARQWRGPAGPPRRADDRRWTTELRGWRDG